MLRLCVLPGDWETEGDSPLQDHENGLGGLALAIDEVVSVEYLKLDSLDDVSDELALLKRVLEDLPKDVKALEALFEHLFR